MRADKFLWCVRIYKTRTEAASVLKQNKIQVNSIGAKASLEIKPGDLINVRKGALRFSYKVIGLPKTRVSGKLVNEYLLDITSEADHKRNLEFILIEKNNASIKYDETSKSNKRKLRDWKNKLKGFNE